MGSFSLFATSRSIPKHHYALDLKQKVAAVPSRDQIGCVPPYERRLPSPTLARLIASAPSLSVFSLGGLPPR